MRWGRFSLARIYLEEKKKPIGQNLFILRCILNCQKMLPSNNKLWRATFQTQIKCTLEIPPPPVQHLFQGRHIPYHVRLLNAELWSNMIIHHCVLRLATPSYRLALGLKQKPTQLSKLPWQETVNFTCYSSWEDLVWNKNNSWPDAENCHTAQCHGDHPVSDKMFYYIS